MPDDIFPRAVDPADFPGGFCYDDDANPYPAPGGLLGSRGRVCVDCGQWFISSIPQDTCGAFKCRMREAADRAPQGVASRLFEPAPEQLAGQLHFNQEEPMPKEPMPKQPTKRDVELERLADALREHTVGMDYTPYVLLCHRVADALILPEKQRSTFIARCLS